MASDKLSLLLDYSDKLLEGAWITLELSLAGLALSLIIGIAACMGRLSGTRLLRWPATFYTTVVRGVPDLVQLFLFYYGGQFFLNFLSKKMGWDYIDMNPFISGVMTIGFIFGAYMAETFRGAILSIPQGQLEAARAYGLAPGVIFRHITWPLMMRYALPGLGNNWLVLLKTTALVSIIGLQDLVGFANLAAKSTRQPFLFLGAAAIGFLVLTSISVAVLWWLRQRYSVGFSERRV